MSTFVVRSSTPCELFNGLARGWPFESKTFSHGAAVSFTDHHDMSRSAMWTRNMEPRVPVASKTFGRRFQPCVEADVCLGTADVERHSFPV